MPPFGPLVTLLLAAGVTAGVMVRSKPRGKGEAAVVADPYAGQPGLGR